jgi:hypothetical protein
MVCTFPYVIRYYCTIREHKLYKYITRFCIVLLCPFFKERLQVGLLRNIHVHVVLLVAYTFPDTRVCLATYKQKTNMSIHARNLLYTFLTYLYLKSYVPVSAILRTCPLITGKVCLCM